MYSCDSSLFAETSKLYKSIVVKEGLNCAWPMEIQYYSGIRNSFLTSTKQSLQPTKLIWHHPSIMYYKSYVLYLHF